MSTQSPGLLPLVTDEQRQVFGELYRSNFSRVLSQCRWLLRSPDDAADAAHEVFVKAIGGLQPGASAEAARAWLLTVARNHCLDVLRRRHRLGKAMLSVQASRESDVDPEMAIVDRQVVGSIFRQLRLRERQALWQSAVEGRPLAEIATDLRLSYVAAAQLLHRARRRAASLAGKVAAWVGLVHMARVARRVTLVGSGSQHVLAAAVLPLVLASLAASSSTSGTASNPPSVPSSASRVTTAGVLNPSGPSTLEGTSRAATGAPQGSGGPIPAVLPSAATSTLSSAASILDRTLQQLPSIKQALPTGSPSLPAVLPTTPPIPSPVPTPAG